MPRGGARQGQPGQAYSNRTDLAVDRAPESGTNTVAAAGQQAPADAAPAQAAGVTPDQVPNLTDPSAYPGRPVTHGLDIGPGAGSEVMSPLMTGAVEMDPDRQFVAALLQVHPSPGLARILRRMDLMGGTG